MPNSFIIATKMLKNIKILSFVAILGISLISLVNPRNVFADHQKCFLSLQQGRETSLVNCPATVNRASPPAGYPDPSKCYTLSGAQLQVTSVRESDCSSPNFNHTDNTPSDVPQANIDCDEDGTCCEGDELTASNCVIVNYIVNFTKALSGIVGIVIVVMIAVGGIQYTSARDDPQAVAAARTRIRNAIMALVFYVLSIAFLQYLVPGGIF